MTELLDAVVAWPSFVIVLLVFGLLPNLVLNILVRVYPDSHPRKHELLAEIWAVPRAQRPLWVAEQLSTVLFEALPIRFRHLQVRLLALSVVLATGGALGRWLLTMPRRQRTILVLRIVVGADRRAVAAAIGMSERRVMFEQHLGLNHLRERLAADKKLARYASNGDANLSHKYTIGNSRPSPLFRRLGRTAVRRLIARCAY